MPEEYKLILYGLENRLTVTGDNTLTIDVIYKKLNHWYEKIKNKREEKVKKEKALGTYNKQYKQRCRKCGKYSHKPGDKRCPENKNEKQSKNEKVWFAEDVKHPLEDVMMFTMDGDTFFCSQRIPVS